LLVWTEAFKDVLAKIGVVTGVVPSRVYFRNVSECENERENISLYLRLGLVGSLIIKQLNFLIYQTTE